MARKTGEYSGSGKNRKQWNGKRWVSRPVAGAPKPSTRRGQGGRGGVTTSRGSTTTTSTGRNWTNGHGAKSSKPSSGNTTGRNWSNPHGQVSSKPSTGNHKSAVTTPTKNPPTKNPPTKNPPTKNPPTKPTPPKKATPTKPNGSTYKKHESGLHIGRYKTLKEHRAAVAATKKKKPDSSQIRAMSK